MNDTKSSVRKIKHGQPKGSALALLLFNIYKTNLPESKPKKFVSYFQKKIKEVEESALNKDLIALGEYFRR